MYGKLFERELDSTMVEQPPVTRLVWHYMIMLCDEDGRVDMTAAAFARRTNIPLKDVEGAVDALSAPDPLSRTPDAEGRRILTIEGQPYGWVIVNHALYRAMGNREDRRRQNREAQQRWRERQQTEDGGAVTDPESAPVIDRKQASAGVKRGKPSDAGSDADSGSDAEEKADSEQSAALKNNPAAIVWPGKRAATIIPAELLAALPSFRVMWIERMRACGAKKPSESAEAKQLAWLVDLLGKSGADAVRASVADATRGGWQGIFPPKLGGNGAGRPRLTADLERRAAGYDQRSMDKIAAALGRGSSS